MLLNRRSLLLSSLLSGLTSRFKIANAEKNVLSTELVKLGNTDFRILHFTSFYKIFISYQYKLARMSNNYI